MSDYSDVCIVTMSTYLDPLPTCLRDITLKYLYEMMHLDHFLDFVESVKSDLQAKMWNHNNSYWVNPVRWYSMRFCEFCERFILCRYTRNRYECELAMRGHGEPEHLHAFKLDESVLL